MIKGEIFLDFRDNYCRKQGGILKLNGEDQPAVKGCCFTLKHKREIWDNWQVCNILNCPFFNQYEVTEIKKNEKLEAFEDADEIERELLRQGDIAINDIEGSEEK